MPASNSMAASMRVAAFLRVLRRTGSILATLVITTGCTVSPHEEPVTVAGSIAERIRIDDEYDHTGD